MLIVIVAPYDGIRDNQNLKKEKTMPLFEVPKRAGRTQDKKVVSKSKTVKKASTVVRGGKDIIIQNGTMIITECFVMVPFLLYRRKE